MNFNELFVVRPTSAEQDEWMITIGNQIATEEKFKTKKAAEMKIKKTDFNLVAVLVHTMVNNEVSRRLGEELQTSNEVKE